jgi:predicted nucleic acid-binding protein
MIFGLTTSQFVILNHINIITNDIYNSKIKMAYS